MNKIKLLKIIESYNLGGLVEQVRWNIKDNNLEIKATSTLRDCILNLKTPLELEDTILGIYNTTELNKLLKIMNDPILFKIISNNDKANKIEISDNQFDLQYNLADLSLISEGSLTNKMPEPSIILELDAEFISKFKKSHIALDKVEVFSIQPKNDKNRDNLLEFVMGLPERYSNKVIFSQPTQKWETINKFQYKVSNFKEILNIVNTGTIKMFVYNMGIMKIELKEEDIEINYYLVPVKH